MAVGAIVARILTQYSDKGSKAAQKDIQKLGTQFDNFSRNAVRAFGAVAVATGALAVKIGKDSIQAAIRAQAEQNRLTSILLTTKGATLEQIAVLDQQATALERVGVVSAGNIKTAQAQLATFDLQASTIQKLTPAILDYVTAEKGAAASASDFKSMTNGLAQALQGNFASLTRTGFILDDATKKIISTGSESERAAALVGILNSTYKDFNKNLRNTPEGKIIALRNALENIKTSIGMALLPVVEKFVDTLQKEVLPEIERWVKVNKKDLTVGLQKAADAAVELLKAAVKISAWVVANFETIKKLALLIASMWATAKVYAFVSAIGKVTLAFKGMQAAAAGAAVASAAASGAGTAGSVAMAARLAAFGVGAAVLGKAAIIAAPIVAAGVAVKRAGNKIRERRAALEGSLAGYNGAPGAGDIAGFTNYNVIAKKKKKIITDEIADQKFLNNEKKKELTTEQKIINAMLKKYGLTLMTAEIEAKATAEAIKKNLNRQERIANSPTVSLAAQGDGSAGGTSVMGSGAPNVVVNITTPHGTAEDYAVTLQNSLNTLARRQGLPPRYATRIE